MMRWFAPLGATIKRQGFSLLILACVLSVFGLAFLSPVSYAGSDGLFNLVVSQALLQQGTVRLDAQLDKVLPQMQRTPYEITEHDGHSYSIYPVGTSLFSLPFVWIASLFGRDMSILDHNYRLQNDVSALLCALVFLILYRTGRYYLSPPASLLITLISVLGSALISTVGTALWSIDWAVFFLALSMLLLVRYQAGAAGRYDPYLLGFTLFAAFLCRPATATFTVVVLPYLLVVRRRYGLQAALTAFGCLLLFFALNWIELGQPLPDYYLDTPLGWLRGRWLERRLLDALVVLVALGLIYLWVTQRRHRTKLVVAALAVSLLVAGLNWLRTGSSLPDISGGQAGIGMAFYGVLFSPSRGLFVFSPFLVPVLLACLAFWKRLGTPNLGAVVLPFLGLHLLGLVSTGAWWSGYAFGPRLLTDVLPALVVLTFVSWKAVSAPAVARWRRIGVASYLSLGILAVFINSYQGLLNANTLRWNGEMAPTVQGNGEYVFDWQYPQFLATSRSLCDRNYEYVQSRLQSGRIELRPYRLGDWVTHTSGQDGTRDSDVKQGSTRTGIPPAAQGFAPRVPPGENQAFLPVVSHNTRNAGFIGWLRAEESYRWSACRLSRVVLQLGEVDVAGQELLLEIVSGSLGFQEVVVSLNGAGLGTMVFPGPEEPPLARTLAFPGSLLRPNALNEIGLYLPGARSPDWGDDRSLALTLSALRIRPAE